MSTTKSTMKTEILVLCHTFFHDAFRPQKPIDVVKFIAWKSSRFVANFIIERSADLPIGTHLAFTSKKAFDEFATSFLEGNPSTYDVELVNVLYNSMKICDNEELNKLSDDDGVIAICNEIYTFNRAFLPILVSNKPSKKEVAEIFYSKGKKVIVKRSRKGKIEKVEIPFPILTTEAMENHLHYAYPEISRKIDEEIEKSGYYHR
jgi:hypothetical protein